MAEFDEVMREWRRLLARLEFLEPDEIGVAALYQQAFPIVEQATAMLDS